MADLRSSVQPDTFTFNKHVEIGGRNVDVPRFDPLIVFRERHRELARSSE
jgi:hypothetical protein